MNEGSIFSMASPTLVTVFVIRIILMGVKRYRIAILISISRMMNHVEFSQNLNLIKTNKNWSKRGGGCWHNMMGPGH